MTGDSASIGSIVAGRTIFMRDFLAAAVTFAYNGVLKKIDVTAIEPGVHADA